MIRTVFLLLLSFPLSARAADAPPAKNGYVAAGLGYWFHNGTIHTLDLSAKNYILSYGTSQIQNCSQHNSYRSYALTRRAYWDSFYINAGLAGGQIRTDGEWEDVPFDGACGFSFIADGPQRPRISVVTSFVGVRAGVGWSWIVGKRFLLDFGLINLTAPVFYLKAQKDIYKRTYDGYDLRLFNLQLGFTF